MHGHKTTDLHFSSGRRGYVRMGGGKLASIIDNRGWASCQPLHHCEYWSWWNLYLQKSLILCFKGKKEILKTNPGFTQIICHQSNPLPPPHPPLSHFPKTGVPPPPFSLTSPKQESSFSGTWQTKLSHLFWCKICKIFPKIHVLHIF